MRTLRYKILIAGVGGQGIVYVSNVLAAAAIRADIQIHISEIHGLSQRGGTVTSGIGLGRGISGFTGKANVDLLIGLEPLETQRCLAHLHQKSSVVFGGYRIPPASVNEGKYFYPDTQTLISFLTENCSEVLYAGLLPEGVLPVQYNIFLLGVCSGISNFPFTISEMTAAIKQAIPEHHLKASLEVFEKGVDKSKAIKTKGG
jgi:indolepyruvate ferredoxin oxidoreductase beta subunit